jgi:hypothetical protein
MALDLVFNNVVVARRFRLASTAGDSRPLGSNRFRLLTSIQGCVLVMLAAIGVASISGFFESSELVFHASLLLTAVTVWHFYSWRLAGKGWFEPYVLFLVAATLFNGAQGLLEVFQLNKDGILFGRFGSETIGSALYLVTLGLASMHFGALAALAPTACGSLSVPKTTASNDKRSKAARLVGLAFMGLSIVPFTLVFRDTIVTALAQGYGGLYGRSQDEVFSGPIIVLANFMVPGVLFLLSGSRGRRAPAIIATLFIALYSVTLLVLGSRGAATLALVSYAWLYDRSVRHLPRTAMMVSAVILLCLFSMIAAVRGTPGFWQDPVQLSGQALANLNNPLVAALSEMGGTIITVVHTIRLVPDVRPFDYGVSYVYAASTAIPNVGAGVHPAIAHGLLSDWLIKTVDPAIARVGGGLGYSFIAEAFANFGWYGTAPVLACFGYFLVRLFGWGTGTGDPPKLAFIAAFLASFLYFARGESGVVVRSLAWYGLIPYLAVLMIARTRTDRRVAQILTTTGVRSAVEVRAR